MTALPTARQAASSFAMAANEHTNGSLPTPGQVNALAAIIRADRAAAVDAALARVDDWNEARSDWETCPDLKAFIAALRREPTDG